MPTVDQATSRRLFLKFLAASPLLAASDLAVFANEAPSRLPDPMMWAPRTLDKLISTPKEAINVFDFEPVMQKNVPPAHFGYMASGIDDEVTLRANREGFLKFALRPRRLVDVSKVDMSLEIFGMKYNSPIFVAPTGGHKGYHSDGETGVANAAKAGNHGMILSTQATTSIEDVIAARGQPIWYQLYATNKWEVAEHHIKRAERAGAIAVAVTVDRNGGRNQETLYRLRRTDMRQCSNCHNVPTAGANAQGSNMRKPMFEGVDMSGLTNTQSSAMTWDTIR
jgi:isopentenyl diphosphate isomerase/L-lactate dehydrogenase-like FMN-dependent dehydrogenase